MDIIKKPEEMHARTQEMQKKGCRIGFVPTMGYLHRGHMSLIEKARAECDVVTVSIFVNPIQFGQGEDLVKYPRDINRDTALLSSIGTDNLFFPSSSDMYGTDFSTFVEVAKLDKIMCGKTRPKHFRGVCTVVLKLLNIIPAQKAYFGQKDYQQFMIIKKMVRDLNIFTEIIGCPIIREDDGLALSSRNSYLSEKERKDAVVLYKTLQKAKRLVVGGKSDTKSISEELLDVLLKNPSVSKVDYFDFRDAETLEEIKSIKKYKEKNADKKILIASAIWIGNTRLIDNVLL